MSGSGNGDCNEGQQIASSSEIKLDIVVDHFLRFCQNVTSSSDGSVPWPVDSIRKSLVTSLGSDYSIKPSTSNEDSYNRWVRVKSNSSVDESFSDCSASDQAWSSCPSTSHFDKIRYLYNAGLYSASSMSPPVESGLHKRKLWPRDSSISSDIDYSPQKKPNEGVITDTLSSDFDDESPRLSRKSFGFFCRNLNSTFPTKIQTTSNPKKHETNEFDSPEATPDKTKVEENVDECTADLANCIKVSDNDSDDRSTVVVKPEEEEDSDDLFRSPRTFTSQKELETSFLHTPSLTELRTPRAVRRSARKLFDSKVTDEPEPKSPRTPKSSKPRKVNRTPKVNVKLLTPSRGRVDSPLRTPTTPRDRAKHALALSAAPESLPCRGKEFQTVYDFVREKISSKESGVLCINGVPGSGKTATIRRVLKKLTTELEKKKLNKFKAIEVNAFDLRRSKEIYRKIYEQLANQRKTVTIAEQFLTERFQSQKRNSNRIPVVLIIDEFDCLLSKKRDVIYKMVEWQAYDNSQLVLLTIANKLDFSDEKKLFSRIKFEKLAFVAYSFKELEEIIKDRLKEFNGFRPEAIQYVARKVAATSGDARKALDICRQVLDTVEAEDENFTFTIDYVGKLLEKIFSNPNIRIIKQLNDVEKFALRALRDELSKTDKSFCTLWSGVWHQFEAICNMDGVTRIDCNMLLKIYAYLASIGLVKIENTYLDQHSKIWLKCDADVIRTALK